MLTLSSLILVSSVAGTQSLEFRDFSHKGPEYAPLENLRFAATDIAYPGSESVDLLGKTYAASKNRVPAVTGEVVETLGSQRLSGFVKRSASFDIFVVEDTNRAIHDRLVTDMYRELSNRKRLLGGYPYSFSSKDGQYVVSSVSPRTEEKPFSITWANGRAVKVCFEDEKGHDWLMMDSFASDVFRLSLGNSLLQAYNYPLKADMDFVREFMRLYQQGFFQSAQQPVTTAAPLPMAASAGPDEDLITAVTKKDIGGVTAALAMGAHSDSVNKNGISALKIAAPSGDLDIVQALLDAHATVDARSDRSNITALLVAATRGFGSPRSSAAMPAPVADPDLMVSWSGGA